MFVYRCGVEKTSWQITFFPLRVKNPFIVGAGNAEKQIVTSVLNQVLTHKFLSESIEEMKKRLDSTSDTERQIKAEQRKLEDLNSPYRGI
jgi:hypothetical protein